MKVRVDAFVFAMKRDWLGVRLSFLLQLCVRTCSDPISLRHSKEERVSKRDSDSEKLNYE